MSDPTSNLTSLFYFGKSTKFNPIAKMTTGPVKSNKGKPAMSTTFHLLESPDREENLQKS